MVLLSEFVLLNESLLKVLLLVELLWQFPWHEMVEIPFPHRRPEGRRLGAEDSKGRFGGQSI